MDCDLDRVFAALRGEPAADERMVRPPLGVPGPGHHEPPPPSVAEKVNYGVDLTYHLDGPNITVQWDDPRIETQRAQDLMDAAELGWANLIVADGWPVPVSGDEYRLRFILDSTVSGSGFTTLYRTDLYPDGYPVTYLNPAYLPDGDAAFELSVAVHELGHMIQYGVRDWQATAEESWYWEATAEWMANRGAPDFDTYAWSSYWYARDPADDYASIANQHQYGMFLLDTWLDEYVVGPTGIRDLWVGAGVQPWTDVLGAPVGGDFGEAIRGMSGAYAAHAFVESAIYYDPPSIQEIGAADVDELAFSPGAFGTLYVSAGPIPEGHEFYADDGFGLIYAANGAFTDTPPLGVSFVAAITSSADPPTSVHYGIRAAGDGGGVDTGADTGEPGASTACACGGGASAPSTPVLAGSFALLFLRRRRHR